MKKKVDYLKLENKIRKLLGNRYHLSVELDFTGIKRWSLYKKYEDMAVYLSEDNKPIMTSENYSLEELYKFAKNSYKYNTLEVFTRFWLIFCWLVAMLAVANIIINNPTIRIVIITAVCIEISQIILINIIRIRNFKADMQEISIKLKNLHQEY